MIKSREHGIALFLGDCLQDYGVHCAVIIERSWII